jgi:hypothetical protein
MAATTQRIELPALKIETVQFTLVGDSPLIVHAWSEKAKRQMLDKQMKKAAKAKEAKDPRPITKPASTAPRLANMASRRSA